MAAECADDPNECTPKKLCEVATNLKGGNAVWSTASRSAKHVTYAQGLGMSCGVVAIVDLCDTDPNECQITQLCEKATKSDKGQAVWNSAAQGHVNLAKEYELACNVKAKTTSVNQSAELKKVFNSLSALERKQMQYALKNLGFYSSGIDGLWGKGTRSAIVNYAQSNGVVDNSPNSVFRSIISKVDVPSSFAAPKRVVTQTGPFTEHVCTTNKFYMKSGGVEFTTNEGMTAGTLITSDGLIRFNSKEIKETTKAFDFITPYSLKFSGNKVSYYNPLMDQEELPKPLQSANSGDNTKLKRAFDEVIGPKTFNIKNNVTSWKQKFPTELGFGSGTAAHTFNLTTHQYVLRLKIKKPDEWELKLWATCDL